jgi:UDP-N-acetylmuramate dehydrogenase
MENKLKLIADSLGSDRVKFDEPIKDHTASRLGGPASLFLVAATTTEIKRIIGLVRQLKLPILVFGSGSKMAISDQGFKGVVLKNRTQNISVVGVKGKVSKVGIGVSEAIIEADSGVTIAKLVEFLNKQNLSTELIKDIPGTVGGNVSFNKALQELVQKIKIINQIGEIEDIEKEELDFRNQIILSVVFKFRPKE